MIDSDLEITHGKNPSGSGCIVYIKLEPMSQIHSNDIEVRDSKVVFDVSHTYICTPCPF